jgi:pseudaminic acid cytidylyltransferase
LNKVGEIQTKATHFFKGNQNLIVAIIPARSGSKRIPGKNMRIFRGKPIIAYSIEAARKTELFDRMIISTDSLDIAEIGRKYGAEVPFVRPAGLADDLTGIDPVLLHAVNWLIEHDCRPEYFCCIFATAPMISPEILIRGYSVLRKEKASVAYPVTAFPHPIFRGFTINEHFRLKKIWPEYFGIRTQDLPETYHDLGQFYWVDVKKYLMDPHLNSLDVVPIVVPRYLTVDIDTEDDWAMAEILVDARERYHRTAVIKF